MTGVAIVLSPRNGSLAVIEFLNPYMVLFIYCWPEYIGVFGKGCEPLFC
jgi:hypothetical protein